MIEKASNHFNRVLIEIWDQHNKTLQIRKWLTYWTIQWFHQLLLTRLLCIKYVSVFVAPRLLLFKLDVATGSTADVNFCLNISALTSNKF